MNCANGRAGRNGWSLTELLVGVVILTALGSLLVGQLGGLMARSEAAHCMGNLRQIGLATLGYVQDSGGALPLTGSAPFNNPPWYNPLAPYLETSMKNGSVIGLDPRRGKANTILQCPAYNGRPEREVTYAPSVTWANLRMPQIPVQSKKIWLVTATDSYSVNPSGMQRFLFPHVGERAHALFFDGRVESLVRADFQATGSFPFNLATE